MTLRARFEASARLRMPKGHEQYDSNGEEMILQLNNVFWGSEIASNVTDQATIQWITKALNGVELMHFRRVFRVPTPGDSIIYVLVHADDFLAATSAR